MTQPHHRRHKHILFALNSTNFECQISTWTLDAGETDGDRRWTFCGPDGVDFEEETDAEPTLAVTFFADWREDGISDFLWTNRGQVATVSITHHAGLVGEEVQFTGMVRLKAPPVGGEARTTEEQEVTFVVTELDYVR